jgi:hypothetical protein
MSILPEGEELHRAVKWVSDNLQEDASQSLGPLVQQAIFKFNLSPKDAEFLIDFYRKAREAQAG